MKFKQAFRDEFREIKDKLPVHSKWPVALNQPIWVFMTNPEGITQVFTYMSRQAVTVFLRDARPLRRQGYKISLVARHSNV